MSVVLNSFKHLSNGMFDIEISPEMGGAIVNASYQGVPVLRPWNGEDTVRKTASYPLVPFSNRIAEGKFTFEGKTYQLAKNFGNHPHTIHGVGWEREWQYEQLSQTHARLSLSYSPKNEGDWPFAFDVVQNISLHNNMLRVEMQITNKADCNAPVGLGWHPFFPRRSAVHLQTFAQKVWMNDERMLAKSHEALPKEWDFSQAHAVGYVGSDNCYSGWNGKAVISWPDEGRKVTLQASKNMTHLVFFTPPEPADFIAVEPVMNANDAINKANPTDHGLEILAPKASTRAVMELLVETI